MTDPEVRAREAFQAAAVDCDCFPEAEYRPCVQCMIDAIAAALRAYGAAQRERAAQVVEEWFERGLFYVHNSYGGAEPDLEKIAAAIRSESRSRASGEGDTQGDS